MVRAAMVLLACVLCGACSSADGDGPEDSATAAATVSTSVDVPGSSTSTASPPASASGPSTTEIEAEIGLEDAVIAYSNAYLGDQADTAWDLLSTRCQGVLGQEPFAQLVAQATQLYGGEAVTSVEVEVDGQLGLATYELTDPTLNQSGERWVLEDGSWRNDDC
jgi:hypothetical protein